MANGRARTSPFSSMTPQQRGDLMRMFAELAREEVRGADEEPQEARPLWKRIPQDIGAVMTGGAVPFADRYGQADAVTKAELAADPDKDARYQAMIRQRQLLAEATKPGLFAGDVETFEAMVQEIAGLQETIELGPGAQLRRGGELIAENPRTIGKDSAVWSSEGGEQYRNVPEEDPYKAASSIGKIQSDFDAGLIDEQQRDVAIEALKKRGTTTVHNYPPGTEASKSEREDAGEAARLGSGGIARASFLLTKARGLGRRAFGPHAKVAEMVAPILSAISPGAGQSVATALTGITQEEISGLRVEGEALLAQSIPVITGEEGARKSDAELRLTRKATKIRDPLSSRAEVIGAVSAILSTHYVNWDRNRIIAGMPLSNDLSTPDGIRAEMEKLIDLGFDPLMAADTARVLKLQREFLTESGATPRTQEAQ